MTSQNEPNNKAISLSPRQIKKDSFLTQDNIKSSNIFQVAPETLQSFFDQEHVTAARVNTMRQRYRSVDDLLKALGTEADSGIMGDARDLKRRKSFFGQNTKPKAQLPPFLESLKDAMNERILFVLAICSILSIITGMIADPKLGWLKGVCLLIALVILVLITSLVDWIKDRQFVALQCLGKDEAIPVFRGKRSSIQTINIWNLVVGDVINLVPGDTVPADCVVITASPDLQVTEAYHKRNQVFDKDDKKDPFLYAESIIRDGHARVVVACVGKFSTRRPIEDPLDTSKKTDLQASLTTLSKTFTFVGLVAAIVILMTSIVITCVYGAVDDKVNGRDLVKKIMDNITLAVILIIVAIPEGLPMVVTISLAFSVIRMHSQDGVLVKDLQAPEKLGQATEICTGKTGTLTTEDMTVEAFYAQNSAIQNTRPNTLHHCKMTDKTIDLIATGIIYNSNVHIEMTPDALYEPVGNGTETALFRWLQGAQLPVHDIIKQKEGRIAVQFAHDPIAKRSLIGVRMIDEANNDIIRIYVKGAPEKVIPNCTQICSTDGVVREISDDEKKYIMEDQVRELCKKGNRVIAFGYKDLNEHQFEQAFIGGVQLENLDTQLNFVSIVALNDPLREDISKIIQFISAKSGEEQEQQINIRLISGDHIDTAVSFAQRAGIIPVDQIGDKDALSIQTEVNVQAMEASEFREAIGGYVTVDQGDGNTSYEPKDMQAFRQVIETLKVIARADPIDKDIVASGLKLMERKVVVVGDGLNDVEALETADVSFAMGSGCSLAKQSANMVLIEDNFVSLAKSIMWGRNIYTNIKRFLQFQITCNLSCLIIVLIGYIYLFESPLNAIQLLWINMIMDTMAALALATTPPFTTIMKQGPTKRNTEVIGSVVWRQIYGMTLWNIMIMSIVMFGGCKIYNIPYLRSDRITGSSEGDINKKLHMTILFQTFCFLQFFNQINCRVVGVKDFNVFTRIFCNWIFVAMCVAIFAVQYLAQTFVLQWVFQTSKLDSQQFFSCVVWGSTALLGSVLLKLTPERWIEKVPVIIKEDVALGQNNPLMAAYQDQAGKKAYIKKDKDEAESDGDEFSNVDDKNDDDFRAAPNKDEETGGLIRESRDDMFKAIPKQKNA